MKLFSPTYPLLFLAAGVSLGPLAQAQWSPDPALNSVLADGPGTQAQPKVVPTADGGAYISWFDSSAGYDVRLQKVDAGGHELFAHNGVLVADRSFSSTQDYGLDVDAAGNALLAFRDDSGANVQVSVAKVSPTGSLVYGPTQVTSTTSFVGAPTVAGTSDGGAVVAWQQDFDAQLQKLDAAGTPLWGAGVTLSPMAGSYSPTDIHAAGTGTIVGIVHQTGGFSSPRHLLAQKLDASGGLPWGAAPLSVFDGGSLQAGNFPDFETDGLGGALFSWYSSSPALQCFVQHIDSGGSEVFPHNGVALSTEATRVRVAPKASYDRSTGEVFAAWVELSSTQSERGVWAQKLDGSGARQWTDAGTQIVPLGSADISDVTPFSTGGRALVFWGAAPGFGMEQLFGARLDRTGAVDVTPFDVSSVATEKSRLAVGRSSAGFAVLAWTDARTDDGDVYMQNVSPEGGLGDGSVGTPYCFCSFDAPCGNTDSDGGCATSTGQGARATGSGSASVSTDDLVISVVDVPADKNGLLYMGASMIRVPFGDGLRCVGAGGMGTRRFPVQNSGAGQFILGPGIAAFTAAQFPPQAQIQGGQTWNFQAWFRDPAGPCGAEFNTSSALSITFAP